MSNQLHDVNVKEISRQEGATDPKLQVVVAVPKWS